MNKYIIRPELGRAKETPIYCEFNCKQFTKIDLTNTKTTVKLSFKLSEQNGLMLAEFKSKLDLPLVCQRCLEKFNYFVDIDKKILLANIEPTSQQYDYVLLENGKLNLLTLLRRRNTVKFTAY